MVLAGLSACSSRAPAPAIPAPSLPPQAQAPLSPSPPAHFSRPEAEALFTFGYNSVLERYIDPVSLSDIGLAGLKALEPLDPALKIRRAGSSLEVVRSNAVIGSFRLPAADDAPGWGRVTAGVLGLLVDGTPVLHQKPSEALYKTVFEGALAPLDPFSRYATSEEANTHRGMRNGFGGVGLLFESIDNAVTITRVLPGTPAEAAGLRPGHRILAIDGHLAHGQGSEQVREWLRGPTNSDVTLTVEDAESARRWLVVLTRTLILLPTVEADLDNTLGIIRITSFNQRTTTAVAEVLAGMQRQTRGTLQGVILDLRGNPGGLLDQAVSLSDLFLERGPIVSTRGRHPDARQFYSATPGDLSSGVPLAVLIDGESASAAEIVAAALQDSGRAVVIGTTSYGKGTVQTVIQLPNGGELTLTWSRFHTPSGYVLHGLGVMPAACTSGQDNAETVLLDMHEHEAERASQSGLWRSVDPRQSAQRATLRASCPPQPHPEAAIDDQVAHRLLEDRALYRQALRLTQPLQAARGL
ncbi:S41 family peptidase [Pararhodospirillum photometricum]|uniref:C-terminal processing peptidase n=1 Tax=Pararhodospirillum photometricum DSM 122 TaxID=1150469 RepID=H6SIK5_PARPM|nr:S41 family peptidase [Pararhodospirillum photometricum]CCG06632.1 C-terminal processing peptidase [Pararhodospirillum photometricum DSM 122]